MRLKTFATDLQELPRLRFWLFAQNVNHVAMESAGVYGKPVWNVLTGLCELLLANPFPMHNIRGRKADASDAEWIAEQQLRLLRHSCGVIPQLSTTQSFDHKTVFPIRVNKGSFMRDLQSNNEWKAWGSHDPYWAVATWRDKQKDGGAPWTNEEFWALGRSDWQDFRRQWEQYGLNTQSCLEIGCGAGRLTRHLARAFDLVHAVDVSDEMIRCAETAVAENTNVKFFLIDGLHLPQADSSVKAIFSTHVLQHLDSVEVGLLYFREFFRVLEVGGTIMIHLPLYQFPSETGTSGILMRFLQAVSSHLSNVKAKIRRRLGIRGMRSTPYPILHLHQSLVDLGFVDVEFRNFSVRSNSTLHPFVLAKK